MKKHFTLLLFLITLQIFSQQNYTFGKITKEEREMTRYVKDTTANAVVLYEEANTEFFIYNDRYINIRTKIYRKIKIFNKEGFNNADVSILLSISDDRKERIKKIKGVTHNDGETKFLKKENIYTAKADNNTEVTFTLPDIKDGSVIEYTYTVESPFIFNFKGWTFQNDIPTIESVFIAEIPGNYVYNRKLIGYKMLTKNESDIKKKCFSIPGYSGQADCEILTYSMTDLPAFIEEDYMTSKWNYISRIDFELSEFKGFDGINKKYSKTWESVDRDFKRDKEVGGQLLKKAFFKKRLPEEIFTEMNVLKRAQKVYQFIQNHYTWNKKHRLFNNINITKAFDKKVGNNSEINLSLINALKASDINTELVLLSTRKNGYPTKLYPVISDFNYTLARVIIEGKTYLLDATDKNLPFGVIPYKCLNKEGRVMDFKNGSYWEDIIPINDSEKKIQMLLKLDEDENFVGDMRISYKGYNAIDKREEFENIDEKKYLDKIEDEKDYLEIIEYENSNLDNKEKVFIEEYKIIVENNPTTAKNILLYPFFIDKISENPFKLRNRQYPVDFGYARNFIFTLSISFPENYSIESIPQNKLLKLPNDKGHFYYKVIQINNKVSINLEYSLSSPHFVKEEYRYLKSFFKHIINSQNEPIILKKN